MESRHGKSTQVLLAKVKTWKQRGEEAWEEERQVIQCCNDNLPPSFHGPFPAKLEFPRCCILEIPKSEGREEHRRLVERSGNPSFSPSAENSDGHGVRTDEARGAFETRRERRSSEMRAPEGVGSVWGSE